MRLYDRFRRWTDRRKTRQALSALDPHLRRDIGLTDLPPRARAVPPPLFVVPDR
jgi:hypothetical protein